MKKILVVVDYQNDFVDGSLGFPEAVKLEDKIVKKIEEYKKNSWEVVFTCDTHGEDYLDTQEGKHIPFPHCIKSTKGWNLYGKVRKLCDDTTRCFEKHTFGSLGLAKYLSQKEYDSVELIGVVTNICVISNAVLAKAALPEAEIIIDASCTASNDKKLGRESLDVMEGMNMKILK